LKPTYFRQAVRNLEMAGQKREQEEMPLFANADKEDMD
jgi:hypothetical protein